MRKNTNKKHNKKKQLIYRKDDPIPPPIKIGGHLGSRVWINFHGQQLNGYSQTKIPHGWSQSSNRTMSRRTNRYR